jgi:hypothetical protein
MLSALRRVDARRRAPAPRNGPSYTIALKPVSRWDWLPGLFLFGATALVVAWQNSRLGVLWDLSYVLENSFRISVGQVPYRDFPFPFPPLTFLIQAVLIQLAGRAFWHHVVYCAVVSGGATALTWRILINLFRETRHARLLAFTLSLPLGARHLLHLT